MGGAAEDDSDEHFSTWQECDDRDLLEPVYLRLCEACSNKVIERHPRLYDRTPENAPLPGAMALCAGCQHRAGMTCTNPALKRFGGSGTEITASKPILYHWSGRTAGGGKRIGSQGMHYAAPPSACSGREEAPAEARTSGDHDPQLALTLLTLI